GVGFLPVEAVVKKAELVRRRSSGERNFGNHGRSKIRGRGNRGAVEPVSELESRRVLIGGVGGWAGGDMDAIGLHFCLEIGWRRQSGRKRHRNFVGKAGAAPAPVIGLDGVDGELVCIVVLKVRGQLFGKSLRDGSGLGFSTSWKLRRNLSHTLLAGLHSL